METNDNRPLYIAFTDLEFTGLDPCKHEIIECASVLADIATLEEVGRFEAKIKPAHIETGDPESLRIAGYKEEGWQEAKNLPEVLGNFTQFVHNSIFACWTFYDWVFLVEGYKKCDLPNPLGYHVMDIFSIAFERLWQDAPIEKMRLSSLAERFGLAKEPLPHRAINGAVLIWEIYKKLR
ncbi:MAG: 3'-5' exonuclease [Candidatus Ryanbacteria bacterium]|nr:3'-5' exonuclease [Candidatus Ryanbacteria bacterium]